MAAVPTQEELKKLKVVELKEKLSILGLSTSGLKADLIGRLHTYYVQESVKRDEEESFPMEEDVPEEQKEEDMPAAVPVSSQEIPEGPGPSRSVDEDLQRKVALQQQMLVVEQQQQHQQQQEQKLLEQQKEALAIQARRQQQAAAMMMQQQQQQPPQPQQHVAVPPVAVPPSSAPAVGTELMEKVRQQQQMLEAEKIMEQQQKMIQQQQQQQQAISQAEAERRHKEAEIFRQQKIALMEAQREEQQMRMQNEQQRQPPHQMAVPPPPGLPVMPHSQPPAAPIQQAPPQQAPQPVQIPTTLPPQMPPQPSGPPPQGLPQPAPAPPGLGPPLPPPPQGVPPPQARSIMPPQGPIPTGGPPPGIAPPPQPDSGIPQMMSQAQPMIPPQPPQPPVTETHPEVPPPPGQAPMRPPPPQSQPPIVALQPPPMMQQPPVAPAPIVQMAPPQQQPGPPQPRPPGMLPGAPISGPQTSVPVQAAPQEKLPSPQLEPPQPPAPKEIKLPHALEKILAFKDVRAQEVGLTPEEVESMHQLEEKEEVEEVEEDVGYGTYDMDDEAEKPEDVPMEKESKNKRRKKKKKKAKKNRLQQQQPSSDPQKKDDSEEDVQIEYIQEQLDLEPSHPNYYTFAKIFEAFKISETEKPKDKKEDKVEEKKTEETPVKIKGFGEETDSDEDMEEVTKVEEETPKLSKKKLKKMTRLSVAQLKQLVSRPDVVEMHDVTAQDPRLLVQLKATRNTVPVPRHWCFKRKYLQGKRGIEKPPFELPEYIKATGIMEMREALAEKEDQKTLKAKMREKVRPKMGKIDIDYQKLHDAFFRWQTKPKMTIHGDLYYEGKEFETRLKEKKPGNLSDELRTALGMPVGPNADKFPPPWLIAMQRYGPPPSYPNLKIPGLNAPIPEATSFGYHAGGWGKPPVDENGKPLYGDVFGTQSSDFQVVVEEEEIDKSHWGELEEESSEEEDSEEEDEDEEDMTGLVTPGAEGLVTPSGITSVPMGVETPDMIELRKKRIEDAMDQGGETPALYTILPEKKSAVGGAMMGSSHIYDMTAAVPGKKTDKVATEGIEVALNPEELDLDSAAMQAKYDQTMREQQSQLEKEDLSDMVAEHAAKQKKRKKQQQDSGKAAKKYKEFKF